MKHPIAPLALLALAACASQNPAARFAEAKAAFAAEDYVHAHTALVAAIDGDASNRDMLLLMVRTDLALGDGDGADRILTQLADLGMHGREWTELSAQAMLLRGQTRDMEQLLADDNSPVAWRLRGEAAQAAGKAGDALADFKRGMAAGSDFRLAWDYAVFMIDADEIDAADRGAAVLRQIGPDRLDTLMVSGIIAQQRGQFELARDSFTRAANRFPARPEPLLALADLADRLGQTAYVDRFVALAAQLAPNDPAVVTREIRVAQQKGDWQRVRSILAPREASLDPHSNDAIAYGDALRHLGYREEARAILQKALSVSPQNPTVRMLLAQCALDSGDAASALQTVRRLADSVLAGRPELDLAINAATKAHDPSLQGYLARRNSPQLAAITANVDAAQNALGRRDWASALAAYRAIPGAENDAPALKLMALAASRMGQNDTAVTYADRALALDPTDPDIVHMAGLVRLNAGMDPDGARALLRQALERDPTNIVFRADLARANG